MLPFLPDEGVANIEIYTWQPQIHSNIDSRDHRDVQEPGVGPR